MHLCEKIKKGIIYVASYIDDNLMIGDEETIDDATTALKEIKLVVKIVEGLHNYLS